MTHNALKCWSVCCIPHEPRSGVDMPAMFVYPGYHASGLSWVGYILFIGHCSSSSSLWVTCKSFQTGFQVNPPLIYDRFGSMEVSDFSLFLYIDPWSMS